MKKLTFILALLMTAVWTFAQQPDFLFEHPYPYPLSHTIFWEESLHVVHLEVAPNDNSEGCYLVAASDIKNSWYYETDNVFPPTVYKVSLEGEVLGELALGFEESISRVERLFDDPDDTRYSLAIGITHDNELHYDRPFLAKFDHDLNLLWQREIELPEPFHGNLGLSAIMDSSKDIVCCLGVGGVDIMTPVFCRLSTEGQLMAIAQHEYPCNGFTITSGGFFEFQDGSGHYGKIVEFVTDTQTICYLIRINRDLDLVSNSAIPITISDENSGTYHTVLLSIDALTIYTCIPLIDGSVFFGGSGFLSREDFDFNWAHDNVVGFMKIDQNGDLVSYAWTGQGEMGIDNDSIKAMQGFVCHDMVGKDAFYFYHTVGAPHGTGYDYINCLVVSKMDVDGNIIWQRYWDRYHPEYDMKVYYPDFLATTSDDGCLVSGYCYYSDIYSSSRYGSAPEIFMLKFFPDGSLSVPEAEAFVRPYMFYPNPVQNKLHLQFSPDVTPTQIELYDLQGRLVKTQKNGLESLEMNGLPSGTYTMRVTLEGGKGFSDKVVKN